MGYGYNKVKGLNALLGIVSTAVSAPIIVAHRLRQGAVSSARGAGKFLSDAIAAARRANRITGTNPAEGSRFASSKVAATLGLWDSCISRMAFSSGSWGI